MPQIFYSAVEYLIYFQNIMPQIFYSAVEYLLYFQNIMPQIFYSAVDLIFPNHNDANFFSTVAYLIYFQNIMPLTLKVELLQYSKQLKYLHTNVFYFTVYIHILPVHNVANVLSKLYKFFHRKDMNSIKIVQLCTVHNFTLNNQMLKKKYYVQGELKKCSKEKM